MEEVVKKLSSDLFWFVKLWNVVKFAFKAGNNFRPVGKVALQIIMTVVEEVW